MIARNGTRFPICTNNRLYYLKTIDYNKSQNYSSVIHNVNSCTPSKIRSLPLEEWHKILGHVNHTDILKLEKNVDDMKITNTNKFSCDICPLSKQVVHRNRQPDDRATAPLQFIHSDIAGPITPLARE